MRLSQYQVDTYRSEGYLFLPELFRPPEITVLKREASRVFQDDEPGRVFERDSNLVRSVYGSHMYNDIFLRLCSHPRVAEPAMQILGSNVYVHQFKINAKAAFGGEQWEWHQDYIFWLRRDGMLEAKAMTAAVFLDDVTEFNGPIILIAGSHREGVLTFTVDHETIAHLVRNSKLVAPKGPAGSCLFFDCNTVHSSGSNMSPFDRGMALITFNSIDNKLADVQDPRPQFLASRTYDPISVLPDDSLMQEVALPRAQFRGLEP
jgi:ectoine hydroxylase